MVGPIGARPAHLRAQTPPVSPAQSTGSAPAHHAPSAPASTAVPALDTGPPPVLRLLGDVETQRARIDRVLARAQRGETFSPPQLLALQMQVYRYAQNLEVVSRVVDKAVSAAKTVLTQQV